MREISHFGSKGARVMVCVRRSQFGLIFSFVLGFTCKREKRRREGRRNKRKGEDRKIRFQEN